jgi:hypothetical protein
MAAYASQARLLRVWRTDIAGVTQAEVAEYLSENVAEYPSTNKATISMWEHARRGLTFEALHALDDCYEAGGALADMAQALGTPFGLPARRSWVRYPSGAFGTGWALLRPAGGRRRIDARLSWGPLSFRLAETCGDEGILLQLPISAPDVVISVRLDEPGWVDFGRGRAPHALGIPVHEVPESPALALDGPVPRGLIPPGLVARFADDPGFAAAVLSLFAARPELARQAFSADRPGAAERDVLVVDRPHPDGAVPRFTGEHYRTLRNSRCFTLSDTADHATALWPDEPVSADRIRRFERGATPQARQLRARLDSVYDAGGYTCNEQVGVSSYRSPFTVTFPRYWIGPVWFAFASDRGGRAPVTLQRRGIRQQLVVVAGASVASTKTSVDDNEPFVVECPYGWRLTAGMGARPAAPEIRFPTRSGGDEVNDDLLSLYGFTHKDLEPLLRPDR